MQRYERRKQNVAVGAEKINGTLVQPGEEFSVEAVVVPFDAENGYALAASYEMGKVVDSYGGGICQVSTTLYVAVLKAELEVTERYSHSMIVHYVDPSMDAAIAEGLKDLKFINNTDAPIYIEASADGSIILPQVVKRIMPSITNEVVTLVKDTSMAFTVSYQEMFTIGKQIANSQTSFMPFLVAGVFYFVFNAIVDFVMGKIEKRMDYYK